MYRFGRDDSMRSIPSRLGALVITALLASSLAPPVVADSMQAASSFIEIQSEDEQIGSEHMVMVFFGPSPEFRTGWCNPLLLTINTTNPPFIFPGVRIECIIGMIP